MLRFAGGSQLSTTTLTAHQVRESSSKEGVAAVDSTDTCFAFAQTQIGGPEEDYHKREGVC